MNEFSGCGRAVAMIVAPVACAAGTFFAFAPASQLAAASRILTTGGLVGLVIMAIVVVARIIRVSDAGPDDPGPGRGDLPPGLDDAPATDDDPFDVELRALLAGERPRSLTVPQPHLN